MSSPTLTTFERFPRLPIELRLKIWKDALPPPRIIEVDYLNIYMAKESCDNDADGVDSESDSDGLPPARKVKLGFRTTTPEIGILKACHESRDIALAALPIILPSVHDNIEIRLALDDALQINDITKLERDIIKHSYAVPPCFQLIRTMAIICGKHTVGRWSYGDMACMCGGDISEPNNLFSGLQRILLVCAFDRITSGDCLGDFLEGPFDKRKLSIEENEFRRRMKGVKKKMKGQIRILQHMKMFMLEQGSFDFEQSVLPDVTIVARGWAMK